MYRYNDNRESRFFHAADIRKSMLDLSPPPILILIKLAHGSKNRKFYERLNNPLSIVRHDRKHKYILYVDLIGI